MPPRFFFLFSPFILITLISFSLFLPSSLSYTLAYSPWHPVPWYPSFSPWSRCFSPMCSLHSLNYTLILSSTWLPVHSYPSYLSSTYYYYFPFYFFYSTFIFLLLFSFFLLFFLSWLLYLPVFLQSYSITLSPWLPSPHWIVILNAAILILAFL